MKSKTRKVLLGAATVAAVMAVGQDAYAAKDNLTIDAKIIKAVAITATQNLDFGTLTYTAAGTLKVDKSGATTTTGGVSVVGVAAKQGQFKISAAANAMLEVTLPTKATIKIGGGGSAPKEMTVNAFLISSAAAVAATPFDITFTGGATKKTGIDVGGTLNVLATDLTGTYTGTAVLTGSYQ